MENLGGVESLSPVCRDSALKRQLIKSGLVLSIAIWVLDILYRTFADVSYINREKCVLYKNLPRPGFLLFEYFIETVLIVFVSVFIAVVVSKQFSRLKRFLPGNPVTAFLYGSLIPVCSCAAIPLISSMRGHSKFSTTISFALAAPLLSPYIIFLSFTVLGPTYGALRIGASFVLVMITALILDFFHRNDALPVAHAAVEPCNSRCVGHSGDVYLETYVGFRGLLPYVMLAGMFALALENLGIRRLILHEGLGHGVAAVVVWTLVGIPLYFCNGAEVLFLRPLVNHGFPVGTSIAFSLTSTTVCATSIGMLLKIIGTRLTAILVVCVFVLSVAIGLALNSIV